MPGRMPDMAAIRTAITGADQVRAVPELHAFERSDHAVGVVARVGLSPYLRLPEIVQITSEIEARVVAADPSVRGVYIQPEVAADLGTPTESIVIRALD